jgi:2-dehydro-3-deoxyphosphogluconate aldolase/(4S)-4-hydroxy-2-oxoglutarate aldolase
MPRFARLAVLNTMIDVGVIPVFYHHDVETAKKIIQACSAAGLKAIEFTNRGDNAYRIFSELVDHFAQADPGVILGVGSVVAAESANLFIDSGANFVVGPVLNPDAARVCNRRKVAYSPGCGSATEIMQAEELGVEIVKVFPGDAVGGPGFVKSILGPMPWTRIMPTGGVEATRESIQAWFQAGVAAVGIGSNLIRKDWVKAGNFDAIAEKAAEVAGYVRAARGRPVFMGLEHVGLYPSAETTGQAMATWYQSRFGFIEISGNSSIILSGSDHGRIEVMRAGEYDHCHVAIQVSDFDQAVELLRARDVELAEPVLKPDVKAVFLKQPDPAGNRVHLIWRR